MSTMNTLKPASHYVDSSEFSFDHEGNRAYYERLIEKAIEEARKDFADLIIDSIDPDSNGESAIRRIEDLLGELK